MPEASSSRCQSPVALLPGEPLRQSSPIESPAESPDNSSDKPQVHDKSKGGADNDHDNSSESTTPPSEPDHVIGPGPLRVPADPPPTPRYVGHIETMNI